MAQNSEAMGDAAFPLFVAAALPVVPLALPLLPGAMAINAMFATPEAKLENRTDETRGRFRGGV